MMMKRKGTDKTMQTVLIAVNGACANMMLKGTKVNTMHHISLKAGLGFPLLSSCFVEDAARVKDAESKDVVRKPTVTTV